MPGAGSTKGANWFARQAKADGLTIFGSGGSTITPLGISYSKGSSLGIQNNGKIVLGGYVYNGSSVEMALVRYNNSTIAGINEGIFEEIDSNFFQHALLD